MAELAEVRACRKLMHDVHCLAGSPVQHTSARQAGTLAGIHGSLENSGRRAPQWRSDGRGYGEGDPMPVTIVLIDDQPIRFEVEDRHILVETELQGQLEGADAIITRASDLGAFINDAAFSCATR